MTSTSVRIDDETLATIRELSESEKKPMGQVIADAVKRYDEVRYWEEARAGYRRLREDPAEWKAWQEETALWDTTSNNGLENEAPYYPEEASTNDGADHS